MNATIDILFSHSAPVAEAQPLNRALSYSTGAHAALFFLLFLFQMNRTPLTQTALTEVNLIQRPAPAVVAVPVPRGPADGAAEISKGAPEGVAPNSQSLKSRMELNTSGTNDLGTGTTDGPAAGAGSGPAGSALPLSGPIVTSETLGWVGRKAGALAEAPVRTGGRQGSGAVAGGASAAPLAEPIALGKMGVDEIRKKESSIGTPLLSQRVVSGAVEGALGGRGRDLAGAGTGTGKRAAALESLKANPLDDGKWGKQKGPFSMEGPLKYRKILKMELPPYPRWAEEKAIEASVSIRLWVDARGKVKDNLYLEKTSGYSELDHIALEALRAFQFVPIPSDLVQEDEWGVATFRFELRK